MLRLRKPLAFAILLVLCLNLLSPLSFAADNASDGYNYHYSDTVTREYFCYRLVLLMAAAQGTTVDALYRNLTQTSREGFLDSSAPYISIARLYGITVGYNERNFAPDDPLIRADAATMLCKLAQMMAPDHWNSEKDYFADAKQEKQILDSIDIPDYAENSVGYVVLNGIMDLEHSGNFDPLGTMKVEEAENILLVFTEYLNAPLHPDKVTVTVDSNEGGVCSENGPVMVNYGSDFTISITANEGMCISSIKVDGTDTAGFEVGGQTWILKLSNVTANHTVDVEFQTVRLFVTVKTDGAGSTSLNRPVTIDYGEDYIITLIPDFGWKTGAVSLNDKSMPITGNTIELKNITEDLEIEVEFNRGLPLRILRSWLTYVILAVLLGLLCILIIHQKKNQVIDRSRAGALRQQEDGLAAALEKHKKEEEARMKADANRAEPDRTPANASVPNRLVSADNNLRKTEDFSGKTRDIFDPMNIKPFNGLDLVLIQRSEDGDRQFRTALQGTIRIGRAAEGNQITVANRTVSGHHCIVQTVGNSAVLIDAGSKNGTVVIRNSERFVVTQQNHVILQDGDELHLGAAVLVVAFVRT